MAATFSEYNIRRPGFILFLSALFGCVIAIGRRPQWQVPIETAQVQIGLVSYPPDSPLHYFHTKSWSLLNQIAGIILSLTGSEFAASMLLEGLVGAVSFAGLTLVTWSICRNRSVALLTPMLMYSLSLVGATVAYPIALLGTDSSYGILGLSYILLTIGLLGSGYYSSGALLTGLAPAIHPTMGIFCCGVAVLSILSGFKELKDRLPQLTRWFCVGCIMTIISFSWHFCQMGELPQLDAASKLLYLKSYIQFHDYHRTVGRWTDPGVLLALLASAAALLAVRKQENANARLVSHSIAIATAAALCLAAAASIPELYILNIAIPWRYTNYANICIIPLCFGLLADRTTDLHRLRATLLLSAVFACFAFRLSGMTRENELFFLLLLLVTLVCVLPLSDLPEKWFSKFPELSQISICLIIGILAFRQVLPGITAIPTTGKLLEDRTNTPILKKISGRPGILLTAGSLHDIQLVTRRAVLLDGYALDIFPYVLDTAPRFNQILKQVYGVDIFSPSPDGIGNLGMITYFHRGAWERRNCRDWQYIKREFAVTDILTHDMWQLSLPEVARGSGLILYTIPDAEGCR